MPTMHDVCKSYPCACETMKQNRRFAPMYARVASALNSDRVQVGFSALGSPRMMVLDTAYVVRDIFECNDAHWLYETARRALRYEPRTHPLY
jgi:hypothetical protein